MSDAEPLSEVTHVARLCANGCAVRYRNADGTDGKAIVKRGDWPSGYYPPGVGDLVRVTGGRAEIRLRPR